MQDKDRVEALLRLYDRQMLHYENTQGIEWKVNIGVWTLLAAATAWASRHPAGLVPTWCLWAALPVAVGAHWLWLWLMHQSEEKDKKLWCRYRTEAERALGGLEHARWEKRPWWKEGAWLLSEVGVTAALAIVLLFVLRFRGPVQ